MRRKAPKVASGRSILVIDDSEDFLRSTVRLLERDGHEVHAASSGRAGLDLLRERACDVVLVDYFMPGMTGEEFVAELRKTDPHVQVVLQTGYASEHPPREMLKRLDIQGYHDKSEGPEKLCLWVDVALRAAAHTQLINKSRAALEYILSVTPELHKIQPLEDLLQGILVQTVGLLGVADSLLAIAPAPMTGELGGFVAMAHPGGSLKIRAATGRFTGCEALSSAFSDAELAHLSNAVASPRIEIVDGGTVVPLRVGQATLGLIYVQGRVVDARDQELLTLFANQAAVAIQNISLYELAAVDQLTRTYTRRFFDEALQRELRNADRAGNGLALLLVDVDDMKRINDLGGHLCGDQTLAAVGAVLRNATRTTDTVGRYGGDEFAVILPGADESGAEIVIRRILEATKTLAVRGSTGADLPVRLTVGGAVLDRATTDARTSHSAAYFGALATRLIAAADAQLYDGKHRGKACAAPVVAQRWSEPGG